MYIIIRTNYDRKSNIQSPLIEGTPQMCVETEKDAVIYCQAMNEWCKKHDANYHFGYAAASADLAPDVYSIYR